MLTELEQRLQWLLDGLVITGGKNDSRDGEGLRLHSFVMPVEARDSSDGGHIFCLGLHLYESGKRVGMDALRLSAMATDVDDRHYFHLSDVGARGEPVFTNLRRGLPYRLFMTPRVHGTTFERLHRADAPQGIAASALTAPPPAIYASAPASPVSVRDFTRRFDTACERSLQKFGTWDMATLERAGEFQVAGLPGEDFFVRYLPAGPYCRVTVRVTDPVGRLLRTAYISTREPVLVKLFPAPKGCTVVWEVTVV